MYEFLSSVEAFNILFIALALGPVVLDFRSVCSINDGENFHFLPV
jgi:hypothetical protein